MRRWLFAALFAATFAALSWMAPAAYYTVAPAEELLAVEEITVEASNETHQVNISYTAQDEYPAKATLTLYRVETNGTDKAVQSWRADGYVGPGSGSESLTLELSDPLPPGAYYYEVQVEFSPGYHVRKTVTSTSDSFAITENQTNATTSINHPRDG